MEKKSKKQVIIAVTVLLLVTLTLLGITYAYYRTRIIGNENDKSISVTSKVLEVTYSDDNALISANDIEPGDTLTKTFNVENTGDDTATYAVIFDNVENNFIRTNDWTFTLKKGTEIVKSGVIPRTTSYVLTNISIAADVTDTYTLDITYVNSSEDQSEDMGASLSLRVNIADSISTTFDKATSGTLLAAIGSDNLISEPLTVPGREPTGESEMAFSSTEDDYGKSYYYRGNVENNYVNFSGMCWRIVRVQGDGTIKITLADREHECNSAEYSNNNLNSAFILDDTYSYRTPKYTKEDLLYEGSNIEKVLNAWLNGESYSYEELDGSTATGFFEKKIDTDKLTSTDWCNDTSIANILDTEISYGAHNRLYDTSTAVPSLKCNFEGLNESSATRYENTVGILTADEIAFAGGILLYGSTEASNLNYYLLSNINRGYWSMTPDQAFSDMYVILSGDNRGYLSYFIIDGDYSSIRPVIVLSNDVTISSGNGTQSNPYVIS